MASLGHELAVHGDTHRSHLRRPVGSTVDDVIRARDTIAAVADAPVRWFRPPYGAVSSGSLVAARRSGLQLVLWTTWGLDWQPRATGRSVAANVRRTYYPGATVVLHDSDITSTPGSWRSTLAALAAPGRDVGHSRAAGRDARPSTASPRPDANGRDPGWSLGSGHGCPDRDGPCPHRLSGECGADRTGTDDLGGHRPVSARPGRHRRSAAPPSWSGTSCQPARIPGPIG